MRPQIEKYAAARAAAAWSRTQLGARPHFRTQSAAARTFLTRNYLPMYPKLQLERGSFNGLAPAYEDMPS